MNCPPGKVTDIIDEKTIRPVSDDKAEIKCEICEKLITVDWLQISKHYVLTIS